MYFQYGTADPEEQYGVRGGRFAYMRIRIISRYNSPLKNILLSFASAVVGAYAAMCVFWIVTGMKYNAVVCCKAYAWAYIVIFTAFLAVSAVMFVSRERELEKLTDTVYSQDFSDEYFRRLKRYIGGLGNEKNILLYASCCAEGGRYKECRSVLRQADFAALSPRGQEEYFNIMLYSALLEGDLTLANEIYARSRHYFDRATMRRRSGSVLHTLAVLRLADGDIENAGRLFTAAGKHKSTSLRFECDIGLGRCMLMSGDRAGAKSMCYSAADKACGLSQAKRLRELMLDVEKAYGQSGTT